MPAQPQPEKDERPRADLVVRGISRLVTLAPGRMPWAHGRLGVVERAALASVDGRILWCGPANQLEAAVDTSAAQTLEAGEHAVIPGFVDSHTHFVFAGDRAEEFQLRHAGVSYEDLAAQGRGILSTVRATRAADRAQLRDLGAARLMSFAAHGTTTVEGKTGYGLDINSEQMCLDVMADLRAAGDLPDVVPTFLGAHTFPPEYRGGPDARARYVDVICDEMLPRFAGAARFCDVFCERSAFSVDEARRILTRAQSFGYQLKVHANQLGPSGGARLAAGLGACSADHLDYADDDDLMALRTAGVVGTLLPGCSFTLSIPYASGRRLLDAGLRIALATDFNPGTCYCENMQMMIALAVSAMGMTLEEALEATTLGGAAALRMEDEVGSLEPGKRCDLAVLCVADERELAYHFGVNLVERTIVRGSEARRDPAPR